MHHQKSASALVLNHPYRRGLVSGPALSLIFAVSIWGHLFAAGANPLLDKWTYIKVSGNHAQGFGLAFGDVNGDQKIDIVSTSYSYINPGGDMTGKWIQVSLGSGMDAIAVIDVDNDNRADVIALQANQQFWLETKDLQATSWLKQQIASLPISDHGSGTQGYNTGQVLAGGKPEVLLASSSGIYVLSIPDNPEAGNWPSLQINSDSNGEGAVSGDIDGDGDQDICGPNNSGKNVVCWKNPGSSGGTWQKQVVGTSGKFVIERVAMADIDGNGHPDIVATEENDGTTNDAATFWYKNPGTPSGSWQRAQITLQYGTFGMDVGDVDNDGDIDVVTGENIVGANDGKEQTIVWENVNKGTTWVANIVDTGKESHHGSRLMDMDGDGDLDIISICFQTYQLLHLWRNDANSKPLPSNKDASVSVSDGGIVNPAGTDGGVKHISEAGMAPDSDSPSISDVVTMDGGQPLEEKRNQRAAEGCSCQIVAPPTFTPTGALVLPFILIGIVFVSSCRKFRKPSPANNKRTSCRVKLHGISSNFFKKKRYKIEPIKFFIIITLLALTSACEESNRRNGTPNNPLIDASLLDNNSYSPIPSNSDFQLYADGASNTLLDSAKDVHTINDSGTPDKKPITPTTFDVPFKLKVLHSSAVGLFSVADIDGDGKNDIIIAGGKAALHWLKHPSLQSYTIASSGSYEMEIQSFDVDSDGDVDVLGPDNNSGTLVWFENPRPGGDAKTTPWKRHEIGTWPGGYPHDFKIGDVNKDKRIDAVICPNEKSPFYLFVQNQPDTWDLITVNGASGVEGTWLGDIDGDGDDDITDGRVWIESPADPQKGPWETHVINQFPHAMKRTIIADINADGRMDVVTADAEFGEGVLAWYEAPANPREVNWKPHELVAKADHNFHTLQVGDINRDGTLDILVGSTHYLGNNGGYVVRIFYNVDGKGMTWKEQSWKTQYGIWQGVLADVGSDGDLDLLSANYQDGKTQQEFWENTLVP